MLVKILHESLLQESKATRTFWESSHFVCCRGGGNEGEISEKEDRNP